MKITIGFSKSKKKFAPFGWAIQWFQGTPFSHAYLRRNSPSTGEYVYQASGNMVNFMGIETFLSIAKPIEEFEIEISDDVWGPTLKKLIEYAGRPYSIKSIIAIFLARFGIKSRYLEDGKYAFICSEIVVEILHEVGFINKEEWGKSVDLVTPKDLYLKLKDLIINNKFEAKKLPNGVLSLVNVRQI